MVITPRFWIANRVTSRAVDLVFRVTSAGVLSPTSRFRFIHSGISPQHVAATLRRVRGLRGWSVSWVRTARHYLGAARLARADGDAGAAATHESLAALCYHYAQLFELADLDRKQHLYGRAATLFRDASDRLDPPAIPVEIPWRDISLPGYLRLPPGASHRVPVVVLLNGASTVKEEMTLWSTPFLMRGLATLAVDTPGSGEAWERAHGEPDQVDIGEAVRAFCAAHPALDARRVALLGISLRGAVAVQLGAADPGIAAVVSVTAPFHPADYFPVLNEVVRREIAHISGRTGHELGKFVAEMSLADVAPRLRAPLLVVGAGNDLVVPPAESLSLYRAAGGPKRLLFLDNANHVAFSHMPDWTNVTAQWLRETLAAVG